MPSAGLEKFTAILGSGKKSFDTFQEIIDRYPDYEGFEETVARQFEIAEALMQGARGKFLRIFPGFKNYEKAQEFMEQVYQNAPAGKTAPLALMNLARIAQQEDDNDAAIDALDRLVNNHAQSILAPDAHLRLAGIYASLVKGDMYDQGATLEAINYYEDFLILYPESHLVGEAEKALKNMRKFTPRVNYVLPTFTMSTARINAQLSTFITRR